MLTILQLLFLLCSCSCVSPKEPANALFSWKSSVLEEKETLLLYLTEQNVSDLYQYCSGEADDAEWSGFFLELRNAGITPYVLTGEPEWGLDPDADKMIREIHRASEINGAEGIVLDVESYLSRKWKADPEESADVFVSAMIQAKEEAERLHLRMIICVPYYLDEKIGSERMERLVEKGCDALAVMNYYQKREAEHLSAEAELCAKYQKELICIHELQAAGTHGLEEINTYADDGWDALMESRENIRNAYPDISIRFAIHDYEAMKEMHKDE